MGLIIEVAMNTNKEKTPDNVFRGYRMPYIHYQTSDTSLVEIHHEYIEYINQDC